MSKEEEILERQRQLAARLLLQRRQQQPTQQPSQQPTHHHQTHQQRGNGGRQQQPSVSKNAAASAARAKPKPPPPPPSAAARQQQHHSKPRGSTTSTTATKAAAATTVAAGKTKGEAIDLTKPAAASAVAAVPGLKRASKKPSSAALVAAARARASAAAAAATTTTTGGSTAASTTSKVSKEGSVIATAAATTTKNRAAAPPKPSPTLTRKTITTATTATALGGGKKPGGTALLLANLVAGADATAMSMASSASLPTIKPDDFWKHLREWDLVGQYYKTVNAPRDNSNANESTTTTTPGPKPVPDTFLNPRHYTAAWAPLCLAECRAQIVQEVTAKATYGGKGSLPMVPVKVKTTASRSRNRAAHNSNGLTYDEDQPWLQGNETGVYVVLQAKDRQHDRDWSFPANELVLLVVSQHKDLVQQLTSGRGGGAATVATSIRGEPVGDYGDCAMVGHVETGRKGINGLIVKVSARKWASIGQNDMYLASLGSNVTALREFTALCGMELLPLQHYLLGHHLQQQQSSSAAYSTNGSNKSVRKLSRHSSVDSLLAKMGGPQALGAGFVAHARRKFNASQLTAIAASANEYGAGGFTLIKGPPGTGKTTTLVAVLNSLHIRQYNKYYEEVRRLAAMPTGTRQSALEIARKSKPRLLVCGPSNAAVDNIILKIMEDGFVDGQGQRYNPSMIRVGIGQSAAVRAVSLETKVDSILSEHLDAGKLENSINGYRVELSRITQDITKLRRRAAAILSACPWPLSKDFEIRVHEETFDETGQVFFVNHKDHTTTYEVPPPPEPDEAQFQAKAMPEYKTFMSRIVKLVESYFTVKMHLERCTIVKGATDHGSNPFELRRNLETHVLDSVHIVMTTLGTAGNRTLEAVNKFEVVVVDEAAQSVEPATLSALHLGSRHAVLVGDPQQLPATIFNVSGRNSKYDRSLFQRLEEAGQPVYMLNEQYRMHPAISHFPRHIFYGGTLLDGPNVRKEGYGDPMRGILCRAVPAFQPFTILDLDSKEERGGTSLSNFAEAKLTVYLYQQLVELSRGLCSKSRVAVITPYAQQSKLLHQSFSEALGPRYADKVEVNTVDAFQGREANVVIFSAVRAAGSHGIGFLSDVRRMNVALTRAKHFLFVIARCDSIVVNPYWGDLVQHARETSAVVRVPMPFTSGPGMRWDFGDPNSWAIEREKVSDPRKRKRLNGP